jgi:hypothetical protein
MGSKEPKEIHNFLTKKHSSVYEDILEGKMSRVKDWFENRDGIGYDTNTKKLFAEEDKIIKEPELLKAYKTPEKYREGEFKVYLRKDDNLNIAMKLDDESINWFVKLENEDNIFDLFGKAGKYPAEVAKTSSREKVVDSGSVKLGVQKEGYHEYFLNGNKFQTKIHFRVVESKGDKMWIVWTGYKQEPADDDEDKGLWNIYEDRYNSLTIPTE